MLTRKSDGGGVAVAVGDGDWITLRRWSRHDARRKIGIISEAEIVAMKAGRKATSLRG